MGCTVSFLVLNVDAQQLGFEHGPGKEPRNMPLDLENIDPAHSDLYLRIVFPAYT